MGGLCANPNPVVWAVRAYPVSTDRRIHDDSSAPYESVDNHIFGIGAPEFIAITHGPGAVEFGVSPEICGAAGSCLWPRSIYVQRYSMLEDACDFDRGGERLLRGGDKGEVPADTPGQFP